MQSIITQLAGDALPVESPAEVYHENSKGRRLPSPGGPNQHVLRAMAHGFKVYRDSPAIQLPPPIAMTMSLSRALAARRSIRTYADRGLSLGVIATILHAANGLCAPGTPFRTTPSGGGLYPLELYAVAVTPGELAPGAYHYDVRGHRLERLPGSDDVATIRDCVFVPETSASVSLVLVVSAVFGRGRIKYGERAYRFALLEAGHALQNVALVSTALAIGMCPFGGFVDDEVNTLLGLDGVDEAAIYLAALGPLDDDNHGTAARDEDGTR